MGLAEIIKPNIEAMLCPVHVIHPTVETLAGEFQIISCCAAFHTACKEEAEHMLSQMDVTLNLNIV
jgi:hypothetical protein